jgi:hypothetical protein
MVPDGEDEAKYGCVDAVEDDSHAVRTNRTHDRRAAQISTWHDFMPAPNSISVIETLGSEVGTFPKIRMYQVQV